MKTILSILLSLLPLLLNAQTFHLLIFADTESHAISDAAQSAKTYFQHSFANKIRQNYGYNVNVVAPVRFDISSIESSIMALQTSADDVIFFYFMGHGFNCANSYEQYPALYTNGSKMWLTDIYNSFQIKRYKTLIVIAETDNRIMDIQMRDPDIIIKDEMGQVQYLVSSSQKGQCSYFVGNGGLFFQSFKEAFEDEVNSSSKDLSWDRIFRNTSSKTEQKARENSLEQTPQWIKE